MLVTGAGRAAAAPVAPRRLSLPEIFALAVWFGLLTGLGEVAVLGVRPLLVDRFSFITPDVVWLAPLADIGVMMIPAALLSLLGLVWPRAVSLTIAVAVFSAVGFTSLLLMYEALHRGAALLLGIGLALQAARVSATRPGGFLRLVDFTTGGAFAAALRARAGKAPGGRETVQLSRRQVLVAAGTAVTGLLLGDKTLEAVTERRALAKLPPPRGPSPNVLLIVLDTVRAPSLSLHGYARPTTPELERFARRGVRFDRAIAPAPWTLPAHASLFTGRHPHELSARWLRPLDRAHPTLAEVLARHGYLTTGFVGNTMYCTTETGLARGFVHYEDYRVSAGQAVMATSLGRFLANDERVRVATGAYELLGRKAAPTISGAFIDWVSKHPGRPFFAFLNYFDAHDPYLPPAGFAAKFGVSEARRTFWVTERPAWAPDEVRSERNAYEAAIAALDHHLGGVLDELDRRGILDNTLTIVTSDHGEEFYEHGLMNHGSSLYLPSLHVPLVVCFPGRVPPGKVVTEPVGLRDIPATVVDLLRLGSSPFPGASLRASWSDGRDPERASVVLSEVRSHATVPAWYPLSKGDMMSVVSGRLHYIRNGNGREELYDIERDPFEERDLSGTDEGRRRLPELRAALAIIRRPRGDGA